MAKKKKRKRKNGFDSMVVSFVTEGAKSVEIADKPAGQEVYKLYIETRTA